MFDIVLNSSVVWSDLSHPEGLSGLVVDVWSAGASERRRSAPASLHAAGRFSSLSGAAGGAVPQTHVPMLTVSNLETEPSGSTEQPWAGALTEEDGSDSPQTISLSYSTEPLTLCDIDWSDGLLNPSDDPSVYGSLVLLQDKEFKANRDLVSCNSEKKNGIEVLTYNCETKMVILNY